MGCICVKEKLTLFSFFIVFLLLSLERSAPSSQTNLLPLLCRRLHPFSLISYHYPQIQVFASPGSILSCCHYILYFTKFQKLPHKEPPVNKINSLLLSALITSLFSLVFIMTRHNCKACLACEIEIILRQMIPVLGI